MIGPVIHPHDDPEKRELVNRRKFSFRLNIFFFMTFAIFSVLIVRLAILQFVEGPGLKKQEYELSYKAAPIAPLRGTIFDASGQSIAYSTSTQSLYFNIEKNYGDPSSGKLTEAQQENRAEAYALAKRLAETFRQYGQPEEKPLTANRIYHALMDLSSRVNYSYTPRIIKTGLTRQEVAYFLEHRPEFPGIDIVEDSVRNYNPMAVQTVGYLKKFKGVRAEPGFYQDLFDNRNKLPQEKLYLDYEDVGFDGIERMYQEELRGLNGVKKFPVNVANRVIGPMEVTKPQRGNNIHLTIHRDIQKATEEAIMRTLEKIRNSSNRSERAPNAHTGFAVAMEVETGHVVSIASMPDYNPDVWKNGSISPENYKKYQYYLLNGAIRDVPAPYEDNNERMKHPGSVVYLGSTMKPLTVLIGLQEKLFSPGETYSDYGYAEIGRAGSVRRIWNSGNASFGPIRASRALQVSSNSFMIDMIGKRLYSLPTVNGRNGLTIWDEYMEGFGLGVLTGSGLPLEQPGRKDYLIDAEQNSAQSALAGASFGQMGKYTTLQLAQYAATLANRGERIKPQLVSKITDRNGQVIRTFGREVLNRTKIEDEYWRIVEDGMSKVTAHGFDGFPYPYYRKTGTSQQQGVNGEMLDNAVFIAYAPQDKPKLAVAVVVPEGGFGAYGAAPIGRAIFDAYDEVYGLTGKPKKKAKAPADSSGGRDAE